MFQLPLLGSGGSAQFKGSGPDAVADGNGLAGLFPGAEGQLAGFSGELQAMLMQLSPQLLQQLEGLLAGGMSLPQAAKSLLAEAGGAGQGKLFDRLLEQGLAALEGGVEIGPGLKQTDVPGTFARWLGDLRGVGPEILAGQSDRSAATIALASQAPDALVAANRLPPQLASGLLNMGVPQQVGGRDWGAAIADRVLWMVQGEQQFAKLRLNPPNLGPLEVRVSVHQDQTSVAFLAQHAAVREALEAALPRLREMFDQQSLQLVRADVGDPGAQQGDGAGQAGGDAAAHAANWGAAADGAGAESEEVSIRPAQVAEGLVDLFA